jgi:RimJ/RimL family protein N-acetyltransferase
MYLEGEQDFYHLVGLASRDNLTEPLKRAIRMKLEKMDNAPARDQPWLTYWLIKVPPDSFGAGMIGFKGAPDHKGEVEIGYGIDSIYRNQGYMTEAVTGMIRWAFRDSRCQRILAPDTVRSNLASNRVLQKVGMRIYQEKVESLSWHLDKEWGMVF